MQVYVYIYGIYNSSVLIFYKFFRHVEDRHAVDNVVILAGAF